MALPSPGSLLLDRQVNRDAFRDEIHGLRHRLSILTPGLEGVLPRRNILDLEVAVLIGYRKVRRRHDNDIAGHLRMDVAEQGGCSRIVELERLLLAFWPSAEVVREFLVAADRRPIDVVADGVAIQKIHGGSLQNDRHVRDKRHLALVDQGVLGRSIEFLSGNGVHVHGDMFGRLDSLDAHLSPDLSRPAPGRYQRRGNQHDRENCSLHEPVHFPSLLGSDCRPVPTGAYWKQLEDIVNSADNAVCPEKLRSQWPGERLLPAVLILKRDFDVGTDQELKAGADAVPRVKAGGHSLLLKIRG